jgi:hypothetical protein
MADALQVIKLSLLDMWDDFVQLILMNLIWSAAVLLPLLPLFSLNRVNLILLLALCLVLSLPLPIVSAGLCYVANQIVRRKSVNWETWVAGIRRYWAKGLIVALINLVILILLAVNIQFYAVILEGGLVYVVLGVWAAIALYWLLMQMFWFPMILELENEKVLTALRSALAMVFVTPGFSLTLGVFLLLLVILSILLTIPILLFTTSLVLLVCNHATRSRLAFGRKLPYEPGMTIK